ncbi:hypothetical protein RHSIM_Rhsim08G0153900 [Rhododendron simsii]|uniref:Uncharacterized protein n=1 Tax=Rhododendron simsii TaxID=118357 RepID=A0A834LI65_RHOSS|nr:hypothetical protein RHSIM_Rhsim08G0153900 [Rhododendron simsii]
MIASLQYVANLREQLEELAEEKTLDGLSSFTLGHFQSTMQESEKPSDVTSVKESPSKTEREILTSPKLRRRFVPQSSVKDRPHNYGNTDHSTPVKLDAAAQTHIQKHRGFGGATQRYAIHPVECHDSYYCTYYFLLLLLIALATFNRKLQEDLTDEMVGLAQQLKESSFVMSQSIKNTEKVLDSTEKAVEHSLASPGRVNTRAMDIYSKTFKTTCFTWLVMFVMTCIFIMVVLLIRVT